MSAHYFDHHPASDYQPSTLIELLRWRASRQARQEAYTFLLDGESEEARLTYEELDRRERAVGAWLQTVAANGDRVLLLYPPGLDYIAAFFGYIYAGAIALSAYPPNRQCSELTSEAAVHEVDAVVGRTWRADTKRTVHGTCERA